jgi:DNA-binding transcriptional regulator YdaS (Cro superfamily)
MMENGSMRTDEFCHRAALTLGGRGWMTRLASALGVHYATVKRWANGEMDVPEYAAAAIELLEIVPAALRPKRFTVPQARQDA